MRKSALSFATLLALAAVFAFTTLPDWQITDQYHISFSSADAGGIFRTFSGRIVFDEQNIAASKFDVTIDAASLNTGNGLQNRHAKSAEWFDVARYPEIRYTSEKIEKTGTAYRVVGILSMHGVEKEIGFPFNFQPKGDGAVFSGDFTLNRNDFHIGKPGGDVGELIKVSVSVPVTRK